MIHVTDNLTTEGGIAMSPRARMEYLETIYLRYKRASRKKKTPFPQTSPHHSKNPRLYYSILGSTEAYRVQSSENPGTYYLTPGWIEKGQPPLSKFRSYAQSYDEETAKWVLHEEMKHYIRIALIDTGVYPMELYRSVAKENAEFLGVVFEELQGSPQLFRELICGPRERNFLILERGQSVQEEMFLDF
ncbi:MAG: DUF1638 domain-containing protein [Deltaproteobacteria bacterium]|nr:DUF1638 domain-containing protein [Deltaproteobacteria bacterium]